MKVICSYCSSKFDVHPENFANHEIVFCPVCGLDHEVIKEPSHAIVECVQLA